MKYKTIDLCAGIGGIRRGFELTGRFENVLSAENDAFACIMYKHLFGEDPQNDVTSEEFKRKVEETEYDVLLAGFPCQAFSRAGDELGFEDKTKGTIFFHLVDIIKRTHPKVVFLENVDNLVRHNNGDTFETIINCLEKELDYKVVGVDGCVGLTDAITYNPRAFIRNSKNFGIPQNRPRVYIIAFSREYYGSAVDAVNNNMPEYGEETIYNDLNEVLQYGAEDRYYLSSGYFDTLIKHKKREHDKGNGYGYRIVNAPGIEKPIANTIMATGGSGKERNLIIDWQDDIPNKEVLGKKSPLNSECVRNMTPDEWGKLQGFINYAFIENGVDTFSYPENLSDAQKYKQFGNSVTIPVIKKMAEFILECLDRLE